MVSLNLPELSLDLSPPVTSSHILNFLTQLPVTGDCDSDDLSKLNDFITGLEDELKKIQAFKRELPLSCLLLDDAIGKLKEEAKAHEERRKKVKLGENVGANLEINYQCDMKTWMSSAQLWSPRNEEDDRSRESETCKYRGEGGAFPSSTEDSGFSRRAEDTGPGLLLMTPGLKGPTTVEPGSMSRRTGGILPGLVCYTAVDQTAKPQTKPPFNQTARKQRRSWSPELHRRFVDALEKLGGSKVATPKQIRDLMQVDGLTNDEVKSHLQKYRLHVRKLPSLRTKPPSASNDISMGRDQLELGCSKLDLQHSHSPKGPLHLARSGKCNSTSIEEDEEEEKSDGQSWKVVQDLN